MKLHHLLFTFTPLGLLLGPARGAGGHLLGRQYKPGPASVVIQQSIGDSSGKTPVRNELPPEWKEKGCCQRNRDLGQVFTADSHV